jgi:predicted metalloprotease with PDZ domain
MKKFKVTAFFSLIVFLMQTHVSSAINTANITYTVTFPEAQAHYVDIEMNISGLSQATLLLKMPVWTPGSYLVREYEKNVESFSVTENGSPLSFVKTRKNWWSINTQGKTAVIVKYRVYCKEISVRTSTVDVMHGFLSCSGIFMYPDGMLHSPSTIHIVPYKGWDKISTSLEMVNNDPFTRYAPNYDILYDSPIELGNQDVFHFKAAGVDYEVCMTGGGNYDAAQLKIDMAKIVEQETAVYGENPNKHYVFIVHNYSFPGGGLEHLSSCVLGAVRDRYNTPAGYQSFLTLVSHEHFHLWNVKRLRPIALGPFDYDNENYTTDLWIAEGFTAYYEDITLRHAGIIDVNNYLSVLGNDINQVENTPGRKYQSLSEASYDAWIKAYRPDENTANTTISYYSKGSVAAMLLNLEIINDSHARYSLDDAMRYMYIEYYKTKKRGYTDAEFKAGLEKFAGKNLDAFYKKYIYGTDDIDYNKYLGYAGYQAADALADTDEAYLGVGTAIMGGKITVTTVSRNGPAWIGGINAEDQIASINSAPIASMQDALKGTKPGDKITVTVIRDGLPMDIAVTLLRNPQVRYKISTLPHVTPQQLAVRNKWLKL